MTGLCDHCGEREREFRRPTEPVDSGCCLECIRDHGEDERDWVPADAPAPEPGPDFDPPPAADLKYVNAYGVTKHYGGPEEGGWWYESGQPMASVPFPTDAGEFAIKAMISQLRRLLDDRAWGDIHSMRGGCEVRIEVEDHMARVWPETRPFYE
jgi:hypothetical protein